MEGFGFSVEPTPPLSKRYHSCVLMCCLMSSFCLSLIEFRSCSNSPWALYILIMFWFTKSMLFVHSFVHNSRLKLFLGKLMSRWSGPYTIVSVTPFGVMTLKTNSGYEFKVNGQKLQHYLRGRPNEEES